MRLNATQRRLLNEALLAAFRDYEDLERLTRLGLDIQLQHIVRPGPLNDVVFRLVEWCEKQHRVRDLIAAALNDNRGNRKLRAAAEALGAAPTMVAPAARDAHAGTPDEHELDPDAAVAGLWEASPHATLVTTGALRAHILLHHLTRDHRRINGLYANLAPRDHAQWLVKYLKLTSFLSLSAAFVNAGSVLECDLVARALLLAHPLLSTGAVRILLREAAFEEAIEKKNREYALIRDDFPVQDAALALRVFRLATPHFQGRGTSIGDSIAQTLSKADSTNPRLRAIELKYSGTSITALQRLPYDARARGLAATWSTMKVIGGRSVPLADVDGVALMLGLWIDTHCQLLGACVIARLPYGRRYDCVLPTSPHYVDGQVLEYLMGGKIMRGICDAPVGMLADRRDETWRLGLVDELSRWTTLLSRGPFDLGQFILSLSLAGQGGRRRSSRLPLESLAKYRTDALRRIRPRLQVHGRMG